MQAALMSQLSIIKFGAAGEIAGLNMPPPPDKPTGSQLRTKATHNSQWVKDSSNISMPRQFTDETDVWSFICTLA